jgi:hypothetical protein
MERIIVNRTTLAILGLFILALIPVGGSLYRIADVSLVAPTPDSVRFHDAPLPILLHATGAALFLVLGALQFRPRRGLWHRRAGKVAMVAGLVGALAGLWMTLTYPSEPANPPVLQVIRLTVGPLWALAIILAFVAIRQRDFARHRAWMMRAYAVGAGAGTAVLMIPLFGMVYGQAVAWTLNLIVAEYLVRRQNLKGARI